MPSSSESRQRILDFIRGEIEEKGYPPSVREICAGVGLKSTSTVHAHLNNLEKEGLIRRDATKPRALELLDDNQPRSRSLPLISKITPDLPLLSEQNIETFITLPHAMVGDGELFCIRMENKSVDNLAMLGGDIIVVRRQTEFDNADVIAEMNNGELNV